MRGNRRFRVRSLVPAILAIGALVALPGLAGAAWDGTQAIGLGDKVSAEFAVNDTSHHEFTFYAPKGTVLNVRAKAAAGLTLGFGLVDARDAIQALGATVSPLGIKKYVVLADGYYTLNVRAQAGSGAYFLATSGKFPAKVTGDTAGDFLFGALGGSVMNAVVKPARGSSATAVIAALKCPGRTVTITAGGTKLSKILLPANATYTLDLTVTGTGNVTASVQLKSPKFRRVWSFGAVENTEGSASGVRADWKGSPHNDLATYPFQYFLADGDAFAASHQACSKCHSSGGYRDWLGTDGTAFEAVNNLAVTGTTVDCEACHNPVTATLSTVLFPSGNRIDGLGPEARCMQCHQGVESTDSVNTAVGATADDAQIPGQSSFSPTFKNVHYLAAAATLYGREAEGGYQYAGKSYNGTLEHVDDYRTCVQCHDQHSTTLRLSECADCHAGVTDYASLKNVRMERSVYDYDGDGNDTEGMANELSGLADTLYTAIQAYGSSIGFPITYDSHAYPYFFNDDGTGAVFTNMYNHWTPRLLRAAYNYQYWQKDPGAYAHNSRYVMQLLYDSIESLNASVAVPNFAGLVRGDTGHFDATSLAFRDWDKAEGDSDGLVNINCAQCHSSEGFVLYATTVTTSSELSIIPPAPGVEGMRCESCHQSGAATFSKTTPPVRYIPAVWFASSKVGGTTSLKNGSLASGEDVDKDGRLDVKEDANGNGKLDPGEDLDGDGWMDVKEDLDGDGKLDATADPSFTCMTCHQGRQSKQTIDDYILVQNTAPKASSSSFQNVHYLPAGGILYATTAKVGYEYAGRTYAASFTHLDGTGFGPAYAEGNRCTYCHLGDHTFEPQLTDGANGTPNCLACHTEATGTDVETIRKNRATDYDVDGDATEHLAEEVESFADALYAEIRNYANSLGAGKGIYFDGSSYPYWYFDTDGNGIKDSRGEDANNDGAFTDEDKNNDGVLQTHEDSNKNGILDTEDTDNDNIFDSDWAQYPFWKDDVQNVTASAQGRMLKAAHNYQMWVKEPGAWAHNTKYIVQLLYDSLDDLNDGTLNANVATLPGGAAPPARP